MILLQTTFYSFDPKKGHITILHFKCTQEKYNTENYIYGNKG